MQKIFVADDWGLSKPINDSILLLVKCGLVGRVSLIVNAPFTEYLLDELKKYSVDISFHFNLTSGVKSAHRAVGFRDLVLGRYERSFVSDQFAIQVEVSKQLGLAFSILESHQYIHFIPSIGKLLAPLLLRNKILQIRSQESVLHPTAKLGSFWAFRTNYKEELGFEKIMTAEFLLTSKDTTKLMVIHPASSVSEDTQDPWRFKRYKQFLKIKNEFLL